MTVPGPSDPERRARPRPPPSSPAWPAPPAWPPRSRRRCSPPRRPTSDEPGAGDAGPGDGRLPTSGPEHPARPGASASDPTRPTRTSWWSTSAPPRPDRWHLEALGRISRGPAPGRFATTVGSPYPGTAHGRARVGDRDPDEEQADDPAPQPSSGLEPEQPMSDPDPGGTPIIPEPDPTHTPIIPEREPDAHANPPDPDPTPASRGRNRTDRWPRLRSRCRPTSSRCPLIGQGRPSVATGRNTQPFSELRRSTASM